jgi:large subunit ribosomal protein L10
MQEEKNYLVQEVGEWLDQSNYVFFADFTKVTVAETEQLRKILADHGAEFHVVKNRILKIAAKDREFAIDEEQLSGPTAIVVGGNAAPSVAKALEKFFKDKQKLQLKGGVLDKGAITAGQISDLAKLPSEEVLKATLLGLLNQPATMLVRVVQAVPQGMLNVLQAKVDKEKGE